MSQKRYISDHLVDMREHLKRNYEKFHEKELSAENKEDTAIPASREELSAGTADDKKSASVPPSYYLPSIKKSGSDDAAARDFRELEGMIIRDISESDQKLEILKNKTGELELFRTTLNNIRETLAENAESANMSDTASLRIKYFSAKGRWNAFDDNSPGRILPDAAGTQQEKSRIYPIIIACAALAGSIIISLVLIALFS